MTVIATRPGPPIAGSAMPLAAAGLVVMWSSGFIGARLGTEYAAADTLLAWRCVVAGSLLAAWAVVRRVRLGRRLLLQHTVVGLLCQVMYLGGVVTGVGLGVPAGVAALVAALQPLLVGALAGPLLGEQIGRRQWVGLWVGLAGVVLVVAADVGDGGGPVLGYLLVAGGMLALSAGTLLERRWQVGGRLVDALTVHSVLAAGVFVTTAGLAGRLTPPTAPGFWWAVAWVVVLSTFGGYGCYLFTLRAAGATRVSTLLYLTPPTTMVWAYVMFGDRIGALAAVGVVVCAVAVWLVLAPASTGALRRDKSGSRPTQRASR
ncbi:MAG: EamA family transporter [Propionibacteriales bacterium]|nr:EamA family transporter [Propionibacteriales bacterium]